MQRMLLMLVGLVCASQVSAYEAENEDGVVISYSINGNDAYVTGAQETSVLKIPETVVKSGISYNVTRISTGAFNGSSSLESVILPNSITQIELIAFKECISLSYIAFPAQLKEIGNLAFGDCTSLKEIELPDNVIKIGESAFSGCTSLIAITIPSSVKFIGRLAFFQDSNLKKITSFVENPFVIDAFDSSHTKKATLYVPSGTKEAYQNAEGWKFANIVEMEAATEGEDITLDNNMQSFCCSKSLDFSSAGTPNAYIAYGISSDKILMAQVDKVPANTGVILKGIAGKTYRVPFAETDFFYSNLLEGVTETTTITSGYVLEGDQFISVTGSATVNAGEAYLRIPSEGGSSRLSIKFTDTITGIEELKMKPADESGWYSLQGTRLAGKPAQGGTYLHQGKKVLVK